MHMTLKRPLISIDLETTGVDVKTDRIVQLAYVRMEPNGHCSSRVRILNPQRPIPKEAAAVHGITDADVDGQPTFEQIAKSLHRQLTGADLTGYNVKVFDIPLLSAEFARCGIQWPDPDTVVADAYLIFKVQEPRKLDRALRFYTGDELGEDAHDALADAKAALEVLLGQSMRYIGDDRCTVADMANLARDPDWIDSEGKAKWLGDVPVINFGKWAGQPLHTVDPTYFDWVCKQDFPEDFKELCQAARDGVYRVREVAGA